MRPTTVIDDKRSLSLVKPMANGLPRERFIRLWRRNQQPGATSEPEKVWRELESRYQEPHRYYHGEQHIAHCMEQLDLAGDRVQNSDQVEMALWFHDIIYHPGQQDNEARSARCFRELASGAMDETFINAVVDLILVTTHRWTTDETDQQFICDIDLASFGCNWERYIRDIECLKAEFPGSNQEFCRGQRGFINGMVLRPKIFQTDFFNRLYEQQARENIERLLQLMCADCDRLDESKVCRFPR